MIGTNLSFQVGLVWNRITNDVDLTFHIEKCICHRTQHFLYILLNMQIVLLLHCFFQITASSALCGLAGQDLLSRRCLSLLEVIEGLGQAGSVRQEVTVVVQRVYSIPVSDVSSVSVLRARGPPKSSSSPPAGKGRTRYCCNSSQRAQLCPSLVTERWENKSIFI